MMSIHEKYRKSSGMVARKVAGEVVLVPISQYAGEIRASIFTLNETAAFAWDLIDGEHSLEDIYRAIVAEFEVEEAVASADLLELAQQLQGIGAIQKIGSEVAAEA